MCTGNPKQEKFIKFELLFNLVIVAWSLILVLEVNRWYLSCFVRFQEIFIHSVRLFLHGTSLLLLKILQAMPVKPRPLRSRRNIRTPQRFLAMNNTLILLHQMFSLK